MTLTSVKCKEAAKQPYTIPTSSATVLTRVQAPILLSSPLCSYLGPRAGGAPGTEQGTSCSEL